MNQSLTGALPVRHPIVGVEARMVKWSIPRNLDTADTRQISAAGRKVLWALSHSGGVWDRGNGQALPVGGRQVEVDGGSVPQTLASLQERGLIRLAFDPAGLSKVELTDRGTAVFPLA